MLYESLRSEDPVNVALCQCLMNPLLPQGSLRIFVHHVRTPESIGFVNLPILQSSADLKCIEKSPVGSDLERMAVKFSVEDLELQPSVDLPPLCGVAPRRP